MGAGNNNWKWERLGLVHSPRLFWVCLHDEAVACNRGYSLYGEQEAESKNKTCYNP